jgi:ribosomal protein L7/L12
METRTEDYKQAIELYFNHTTNELAIVQAVLAGYPKVMIAVLDDLEKNGLNPIERALGNEFGDVQRLIRGGKFIAAIKLYRSVANVGLKEAKDATDKLRLLMYNQGETAMRGSDGGYWSPNC